MSDHLRVIYESDVWQAGCLDSSIHRGCQVMRTPGSTGSRRDGMRRD
jgi:hypothetical protein